MRPCLTINDLAILAADQSRELGQRLQRGREGVSRPAVQAQFTATTWVAEAQDHVQSAWQQLAVFEPLSDQKGSGGHAACE